jgi:hypothetical protein
MSPLLQLSWKMSFCLVVECGRLTEPFLFLLGYFARCNYLVKASLLAAQVLVLLKTGSFFGSESGEELVERMAGVVYVPLVVNRVRHYLRVVIASTFFK